MEVVKNEAEKKHKKPKYHVQILNTFSTENIEGWHFKTNAGRTKIRHLVIKELQAFLQNEDPNDNLVLSGMKFDKEENCLLPDLIITNLEQNTNELYKFNIENGKGVIAHV